MSTSDVISTSLEKIRRRYKLCIAIFVISLGVFVVLLASYVSAYQGRALLNSKYYDQNIAGLDKQGVVEKIEATESAANDKSIKLVYGDKSFDKSFNDLGWGIDKDKTIESIFSYGHGDKTFANWLSHLRSVFISKKFTVSYDLNHQAVDSWLATVEQEVADDKADANLVVRDGNVEVIDPHTGTQIDRSILADDLRERFELLSDDEITIKLLETSPEITREQAELLADVSAEKVEKPITVSGPKGKIEISSSDLGRSLKVRIKEGVPYLSLDSNKIKNILESNLDTLNIEAEDASFSISGGNVILKSASEKGQIIKVDESVSSIVSAFESGETYVELPSQEQSASISAQNIADIQRYGIKEVIGKASTDFSGSPANRVHNIKNGVKFISGTLIAPGDEFSTIGALGNIDGSTGYLPELVIKEDETVPEFGGGLCQVSTTLFRSAMDAGLKITERQNHSYRVSYYEPPVGMDATIYSPKPDFSFVNTTDKHILVYGYVEGYKITFEMYGTSDGRTVSISDPEVYDITTPSETIYIEDPSLAPGEEKRIERAHNGAKARFYYKVYKNGNLLEDETFLSYYVAWPAKYLRGPDKQEDQEEEQAPQDSPVPEESQ